MTVKFGTQSKQNMYKNLWNRYFKLKVTDFKTEELALTKKPHKISEKCVLSYMAKLCGLPNSISLKPDIKRKLIQ